jgi:hypothetical protein
MTTALIGTTPVDFITNNREWMESDYPVKLTVTAPIEPSHEDMVAALYLCFPDMSTNELTDDHVPVVVADGVFNEGLMAITNARHDMAEVKPGTPEHAWLTACRRAVDRVFGTQADTMPARPRPRPLAGTRA